METRNKYLETTIWPQTKIKDPAQLINDLFCYADIAYLRKMIKNSLKAAASKKVYSKSDPGDLLSDFQQLELLINVAWIIIAERHKESRAIIGAAALQKELYCATNTDEWNSLPRYLSKKEYMNPYLAWRRFFKYQNLNKWKSALWKVMNYALVSVNMMEDHPKINILSIYLQLCKLVEAAHLIHVRTKIADLPGDGPASDPTS